MRIGGSFQVSLFGALAACFGSGAALAQDQLSSSFGNVSGGNLTDSFVVVSGATGLPPSINDVALATIENRTSTIECVHIGGVLFVPNEAIGPTGTLVIQDGAELYTNLLDLGSGESAHGNLVVRGVGTKVLENPIGDPNCIDRSFNQTIVGEHSSGSVLVAQGAELNNLFLDVGREVGASGYVKIDSPASCDPMQEPRDQDCSQLNMLGVGIDGLFQGIGFPAFAFVGRSGTGHMVLRRARARISLDGAQVTDPGKAGHGVNIAHDAGAVGTLRITDQSKFLIESAGALNDFAFFQVGRLGTGTLEISGGSLLEAQGEDRFFIVARSPGRSYA